MKNIFKKLSIKSQIKNKVHRLNVSGRLLDYYNQAKRLRYSQLPRESVFTRSRVKANDLRWKYLNEAGTSDRKCKRYTSSISHRITVADCHDIYIKRIGFSLIRVYREHLQRCNQDSADDKLLSQLKWPIEYMFVGLRPTWNVKDISGTGNALTGNQNVWRDWHRLTKSVSAVNYAGSDGLSFAETPNTAATTLLASKISRPQSDQYYLPVPTVNTLTLTSHGITIFDSYNDSFFNQYMPFQYGGANLTTPDDVGALFVNMALFPRSYQPSGHLNISRARETYLAWTTSYISSATPADLIVVAVAINFLLITDGSAVLRYST